MRRTSTIVTCGLLATLLIAQGCRVERTRSQRYRAREIQGVLNSEAARLAEQGSVSREDFERLVGMYHDLTTSVIRSAEAKPLRVQDAEDELDRLAVEVKGLPAFEQRSERAQAEFDETMRAQKMAPWKQWRGRKLARERRKDLIEAQKRAEANVAQD
ncbi:MAG: hypothetical protein ACIARR_03960 [Phycisphaerales bacterium JB059]